MSEEIKSVDEAISEEIALKNKKIAEEKKKIAEEKAFKKLINFLEIFPENTSESETLFLLENDNLYDRIGTKATEWILELINGKIYNQKYSLSNKYDLLRHLFVFKNAKPNELEEFFLKVYQRVSGKKTKDPISEDLEIEFKDNIDYYYPGSEEK